MAGVPRPQGFLGLAPESQESHGGLLGLGQEVIHGLLGLAPGSGEVMSAIDSQRAGQRMYESAVQGRYGDATRSGLESLIAAMGAVPGVGEAARGGKAIVDFVKRALEMADRKIALDLGKVSESNAARVLKETGLDISGHRREMDNYGVRHAFRKHGAAETELPRGQIALADEDLARIPEIVEAPDVVRHGGKSGPGRDLIVYEKKIDGTTFYVEEVRTKGSRVAFHTIYKRKN